MIDLRLDFSTTPLGAALFFVVGFLACACVIQLMDFMEAARAAAARERERRP